MARSWGKHSRKSNDWHRDNKKWGWKKDRDKWNDDKNDSDNSDNNGWNKNFDSTITNLMVSCQKIVTNTIKFGKFSDHAIKKAISTVETYSKMIGKLISKDAAPDTRPVEVTVKAAGAAEGNNAEVQAHVKLGMFNLENSAKLVVGTAESYAASDDGHKHTYVNAFSSVKGVDTGEIFSYHHTGKNFEKAVSAVVAIDWENVFDKNLVSTKHHNFYSKYRKDIGDGKTIKASTDVYVEADHSANVDQGIRSLAADDWIATIAKAEVIAS